MIKDIESGKLEVQIVKRICKIDDVIGLVEVRENALSELLRLAKIGEQMQWMPVSERLPERCCSCFIWHVDKEFGGMCIAAYYNSIKKSFGHEERFGGKTLYWMPLPEPPKWEGVE